MSRFGPAIFRLAHRWRGAGSLHLLDEIAPSPFASAEESAARQLGQLTELLEHAGRRVPYYRRLFGQLGFSPRDLTSVSQLAQLPVLTKDLVRAHELELIRDDVALEQLSAQYSGGSTGVPLRFHRDRAYMDVSEAGTYRNFLQAGWQPGEMVAFFWGFNERLQQMGRFEFETRQRIRRFYQFDPFRSGESDLAAWARTLRRIRFRVAHGYASTIARFAEYLERTGEQPRRLKGVFTTAEALLPQQREVIGRVFGCPVFDCYGSSEVQNIAAQCPAGRMHVMADFVVLEAAPAPPGQPAPLLVTSLRNRAMPFIRYRNEDMGILLEDRCECGRGFPLMDLRVGRISDNFLLPNGAVVHGEFFTHLLYGSEGVERFQFVQRTPGEIELIVVPLPGPGEARARALRSAVEQVEAMAPGQLRVRVREVAEIPLSAAGKHRFTRSEVVHGAPA
ncbi:MAG TPA: hypothetical protein VK939_04140 [Longimicrobiales bacterium]|nr:hypothetical protein [Longimicrobiales bacterium]